MNDEKTVQPTPSEEEKKWVYELSKGKSAKDLAAELGKGQGVFGYDLNVLRAKYNCNNTSELIALFLRNGFIE